MKEEQLSDIVFPTMEESDDTIDPDQILGSEGMLLHLIELDNTCNYSPLKIYIRKIISVFIVWNM